MEAGTDQEFYGIGGELCFVDRKKMNPRYDDLHCPLCSNTNSTFFFEDKNRHYLRCPGCRLIFVPKHFWLAAKDEKAIYDLHENDAQDQGYRQFLSRLSGPLLKKLSANQKGLDFGCGPGPALANILTEKGHRVDLYDPFYYNDLQIFDKTFDFICATEVVEHLQDPAKVFSNLFRMLNPGGWLGIMTKLATDIDRFRQWHYIRDMTHICFFSRNTLEYIARQFDAKIFWVANDVILLQKK